MIEELQHATGKSRSLEEYLPLLLCGAGIFGVLPFAIVRFLHGEVWIGLLDLAIVSGFSTLGLLVLRSSQVRITGICITLLCLAGFLGTLYLMGPQQLYWGYPALVVAYYLLKPEEAVVLSVVSILASTPALYGKVEPFFLTTAIITMTMTSVFAYAFASLTRNQRLQLMSLATCDPLTGAGNRRALDQKIAEVIANHERTSATASVIFLDLDHFKAINDKFGHAAGDQILIQLTEIINLRIRVTDSLYRIGGEEFVIVVDDLGIEKASRLADQLRTLVEANELAKDQAVTISLGVAQLDSGESADDWLQRADEALYEAKRAGRNQTRTAQVQLNSLRPMVSPLR